MSKDGLSPIIRIFILLQSHTSNRPFQYMGCLSRYVYAYLKISLTLHFKFLKDI
jgi:hypothetical protein